MSEQILTLHSKQFETKGKTYYFNVREAKNGNQYLAITETYMKEGQRRYNTVNVFGDNLQTFSEMFVEMADKIKL